ARVAAVHTLRYRQSSFAGGESGMSTETFNRPVPFGCTHTGPNASAFRTPSQRATGCGAFHRSGPIGGAPNGMPRKTRTPSGELAAAATRPVSVFTGSGRAATSTVADAAMAVSATTRCLRMVGYSL